MNKGVKGILQQLFGMIMLEYSGS